MPDVDLLIRTGGERRLSDFLLWELAYAELYFTDTMWPDFQARTWRLPWPGSARGIGGSAACRRPGRPEGLPLPVRVAQDVELSPPIERTSR